MDDLVPSAWRLVPAKHDGKAGLTPEMFDAFWAAFTLAYRKHGNFESVNAGYNAMLEAAPLPDGPVNSDALEAKEREIEALKKERDEAIKNADTVCDSYAAENQRLFDRAEAAEAALNQAREALASLVDRDIMYDGPKVVIETESHGTALKLVRRARSSLGTEDER